MQKHITLRLNKLEKNFILESLCQEKLILAQFFGEDFQISTFNFCYLASILPWKKGDP